MESVESLYKRLFLKCQNEKPKVYDLLECSTVINSVLRPSNENDEEKVRAAKILNLLIVYHHDEVEMRRLPPGQLPYGGRNVAKGICPRYELRQIPALLRTIIMKYIEEITSE